MPYILPSPTQGVPLPTLAHSVDGVRYARMWSRQLRAPPLSVSGGVAPLEGPLFGGLVSE